jgi:hypothetical protein
MNPIGGGMQGGVQGGGMMGFVAWLDCYAWGFSLYTLL